MDLWSGNSISKMSCVNHTALKPFFFVVSVYDWAGPTDAILHGCGRNFHSINYSLHDAVFSSVKLAVESFTARTQNKY